MSGRAGGGRDMAELIIRMCCTVNRVPSFPPLHEFFCGPFKAQQINLFFLFFHFLGFFGGPLSFLRSLSGTERGSYPVQGLVTGRQSPRPLTLRGLIIESNETFRDLGT
jgi:hypothetical protein